jgi:hypothetical protein
MDRLSRAALTCLMVLVAGAAHAQEGPKRCLAHTFVELARGHVAASSPVRHVSDCKSDYSRCEFKLLQNRKDAAADAKAGIERGAAFVKQCFDKFFKEAPKHDASPGAVIVWSYSMFSLSSVHLCSISSITNLQTFHANNPDQVEWSFSAVCD